MKTALAGLDRGLGLLAGLFWIAGAIALFALAAVTIVSVFWRYILRDPIFGIEDISTMSLAALVAGSVAYGATKGSHFSVNVISLVAGRAVTRLTDVVARVLGVCICTFASYGLFTKGACGLPCGAITSNLALPHLPFYYLLGAAMGFYAAYLASQLLTGLAFFNEDDPNEARD